MTVLFVTVEGSSPREFMWWIETTEGAELRSGVVYGHPPEGAVEVIAPRSLVRGETYAVHVMHQPGSGRQEIGGGVFGY